MVAPGSTAISSCHLSDRVHSVLAISTATGEPERAPVAHPTDDRDLVLLEAHARAAAVAEAPAGQLVADVVDGHRQAGRQTLDDDDEGAAVGLAGGEVPEHALTIPAVLRRTGTGNHPVAAVRCLKPWPG